MCYKDYSRRADEMRAMIGRAMIDAVAYEPAKVGLAELVVASLWGGKSGW
jgi:hypothetical protein